MSDYTHDDAMRVEAIAALTAIQLVSAFDVVPVFAYIERLEAEKRWLAEEMAGALNGDTVVYSDGRRMGTATQWLDAAQEAVRKG